MFGREHQTASDYCRSSQPPSTASRRSAANQVLAERVGQMHSAPTAQPRSPTEINVLGPGEKPLVEAAQRFEVGAPDRDRSTAREWHIYHGSKDRSGYSIVRNRPPSAIPRPRRFADVTVSLPVSVRDIDAEDRRITKRFGDLLNELRREPHVVVNEDKPLASQQRGRRRCSLRKTQRSSEVESARPSVVSQCWRTHRSRRCQLPEPQTRSLSGSPAT